MKLYQPVSPWIVNQPFGANKACVDKATNTKVITCDGNTPPTGYKSLYGAGGHKGVDLFALHNQPVYHAHSGVITAIDTDARTGLDVKVEFTEDKTTFQLVYEHLLGYQGKVGDEVKLGQLAGWADNTGWSSGDHLHWELKRKEKSKWVSIDPVPFLSPVFARDMGEQPWREKIADMLEDAAVSLRKIPHTSVSYEEAVDALKRGPLRGRVLADALEVLRTKYGR